ncbi:unnamed protein product [Enterobius vermicularis]|uniref:Otopetrin-2 n=1 Tax=Enterobius vermicularis TaxID=51028 RepID=A0A158QAH1_ENTVE|nr:unnamed protein product [Enterobius vermicularis]
MLLTYHDIPPVKFWLRLQNICTITLYVIFLLCLTSNFYVLFCRENTVFYLRTYHLVIGGLMLSCIFIMIEFLYRSRYVPKLDEPHEIPIPALIGAVALSVGVSVGYLYLMMYNYAFRKCDKLVDITYGSELYLDSIYSAMMILFTLFSLAYIMQRRYYGSINTNLDRVNRLYINITFCIVWIKVVIYKGYLSHEELCQRHELEQYWCPVLQRKYECEPEEDLHGTQRIWYYLHRGLLEIAVMSCASEIYPVLLIAHWLACGNAEETAEHFLKKQRRGVRSILREFVNNISTVAVEANESGPSLHIRPFIKIIFNLLTTVTTVLRTKIILLMIIRWLVLLYYSMDYNNLWPEHWITNDAVQVVAFFSQMIFFIFLYIWSRKLRSHRLDAHHRASARGDVIILFGCCVFLFVKFLLQLMEDTFQFTDNYYNVKEAVTLWTQFLAIRKILAISDKDAKKTRHFLSFVAVSGCLLGFIHFGSTFLETTIIHYQLDEKDYGYSKRTLMTMIFTQTLFPADYLYGFTVASCWLEVIIRYIEIGFFQVGEPYLGEESHHGSHAHAAPSRLSSTLTLRTSDDTLRFRSKAPQIPSIPENRPSTSTSTESSNMSNTTVEEESEAARI